MYVLFLFSNSKKNKRMKEKRGEREREGERQTSDFGTIENNRNDRKDSPTRGVGAGTVNSSA